MPECHQRTFLLRDVLLSFMMLGMIVGSVRADGPQRVSTPAAGPATDSPVRITRTFFKQHCHDCHAGDSAEAGLDLAEFSHDLADPEIERRWVRVIDRIRDGEMPPPDSDQPADAEKQEFVKLVSEWIETTQRHRYDTIGRVLARRLTRREIERSIQDLLGIDIPLIHLLPEEAKAEGFDTVADAQSMSHFQLAAHLNAVDVALDEAYRRAFSEADRHSRELDARGVARINPNRRCREPEMREGQAVVWSSGLIFYGRLPATTAREDGWYHFRVKVSAVKPPQTGGVWSTVRTGLCVSSAPLLEHVTAFEATSDAKEIEFTAWLPRGHMLEIRPGDVTLKRGRFAGGQVGVGEGESQDVPGIAIESLSMKRVHLGPENAELRRLLFGDLKIKWSTGQGRPQLVSDSAVEDAERLVMEFARRAFRRPVTRPQLQGYLKMVRTALSDGADLGSALRVGYRAILCSPRFLYFNERSGPLDSHAIAARLSYFLTGSTPDRRLTELADRGELRDPAVLKSETDRLLAAAGSRRFVEDFAAQWLDLDQIDFTEPDRRLYPRFDPIVQYSMLHETHAYLDDMLRNDLSVTRLIDSNETYLNSRLARFYDIPGVVGDELRKVQLPPQSHRGGVLTQGAILKVTANGSNTSPVVRGVWISERLLGEPIPPPPGNVPAIEPDIRGATTIREMLAKHRSDASCASCHVRIDPPGFALENFDPSGRWRERYLVAGQRRQSGGPLVDASYVLRDGREFSDVDGFKTLIVGDPLQLARNVAEKMLIYATGAPIAFADRRAVDQIAAEAAAEDFGFRSILHAVVQSRVFLQK